MVLLCLTDGQALAPKVGRLILSLLDVLLPINLTALLVMKERGVFTRGGVWLLGGVLFQAIGVSLVARIPARRQLKTHWPEHSSREG